MTRALAENKGILEIRRRLKFLAIAAVGVFLTASLFAPRATASMYTLPPGGSITAFSSSFPVGGTFVTSSTSSFASITGSIEGTVTSTVYNGGGNPYGGLTFTYLLMLSANSTDSASELTVGSYGGFSTDVSYNPVDGGVAPSSFTRSSTGNGSTIRFLWSSGGGLAPGQDGELVVVQTSATTYGSAQAGVIDSLTANLNVLAPAVPEPAIGSLIALGLGALFAFRRGSK